MQVCHGFRPAGVRNLDIGLICGHLAARGQAQGGQGLSPHRDLLDRVELCGGGRGRGADRHHVLGVQGERRERQSNRGERKSSERLLKLFENENEAPTVLTLTNNVTKYSYLLYILIHTAY